MRFARMENACGRRKPPLCKGRCPKGGGVVSYTIHTIPHRQRRSPHYTRGPYPCGGDGGQDLSPE